MSDNIALYRHGAVAEVVINRPEKMNAMTPEMSEALTLLFTRLNEAKTNGPSAPSAICERSPAIIQPWISANAPITARPCATRASR